MNDQATAPRVEDVLSVGTRVSWSAILAGTVLAMGIYFLLASLGAAVGLSAHSRMDPTALRTGAIGWAFATTLVALFIGGLVSSLFTVGENRVEAVMSGIIVWSLVFASFLLLGTAGIHGGFQAMQGIAAESARTGSWEAGAKAAGVSTEQINEWTRRQAGTDPEARNPQVTAEAATRIGWYAFAGTWLSMIAAAAGGCAGAGPRFRIVAAPKIVSGNLR